MDLGLFLIHAVVGLLLAGHGAQKLFGWFGGGGLDGTGTMMDSLGLHPGRRMAAAAGASELAGGLLLALGLVTPLAAAMIVGVAVVAARTAHAGKGPWAVDGGWEYLLVLGAVAVGLAFNGAGAWSLDAAFGVTVSGFWAGVTAAAAGVAGGMAVLALRDAAPRRSVPTGSATPVSG